MSLLEDDPESLPRTLDALHAARIRAAEKSLRALLHHRSASVRRSAASALGRAGLAENDLIRQLGRETNDLVIAEIAEALSNLGSRRSLKALKQAASRTRSPLARAYCLMAYGEIAGASALRFLTRRLASEPNAWVRACLSCTLYLLGDESIFEPMLANLSDEDATIRVCVANLLAFYRPRRRRRKILAALAEAVDRERQPGARAGLKAAYLELSGRSRRKATAEKAANSSANPKEKRHRPIRGLSDKA